MTISTYSLANRMRNNKFAEPFLERLYPLPNEFRTINEWVILHHQDLEHLSDLELTLELSCLWRRLTLEQPKPDHWLWARRQAIFRERDRRRAS
jgi:hypothetical protein